MRIIFVALITTILSACSMFGPVKTSFPDAPTKLMTPPAELKSLLPPDKTAEIKLNDESPSNIPLSITTKTIVENYNTCNAYRAQIFSLQEWIIEQKKVSP